MPAGVGIRRWNSSVEPGRGGRFDWLSLAARGP